MELIIKGRKEHLKEFEKSNLKGFKVLPPTGFDHLTINEYNKTYWWSKGHEATFTLPQQWDEASERINPPPVKPGQWVKYGDQVYKAGKFIRSGFKFSKKLEIQLLNTSGEVKVICDPNALVKANSSEVREWLIQEAKRRHVEKGIVISNLHFEHAPNRGEHLLSDGFFKWVPNKDTLYLGTTAVYEDRKWSNPVGKADPETHTIWKVKEKKEIKKEKPPVKVLNYRLS